MDVGFFAFIVIEVNALVHCIDLGIGLASLVYIIVEANATVYCIDLGIGLSGLVLRSVDLSFYKRAKKSLNLVIFEFNL